MYLWHSSFSFAQQKKGCLLQHPYLLVYHSLYCGFYNLNSHSKSLHNAVEHTHPRLNKTILHARNIRLRDICARSQFTLCYLCLLSCLQNHIAGICKKPPTVVDGPLSGKRGSNPRCFATHFLFNGSRFRAFYMQRTAHCCERFL